MNWVRHGSSTTFETKSSYCRAKVEFNSINWVRHGSSSTFETGLRVSSSKSKKKGSQGNLLLPISFHIFEGNCCRKIFLVIGVCRIFAESWFSWVLSTFFILKLSIFSKHQNFLFCAALWFRKPGHKKKKRGQTNIKETKQNRTLLITVLFKTDRLSCINIRVIIIIVIIINRGDHQAFQLPNKDVSNISYAERLNMARYIVHFKVVHSSKITIFWYVLSQNYSQVFLNYGMRWAYFYTFCLV